MDIPPVPPPLPPPLISPEDDRWIQRAGEPGRNLLILAALATVAAILAMAGVTLGKPPNEGAREFMMVTARSIALIAAGYWLLAVAARRGNSNAVGVVMMAMALQMCMVMISAGISAARNDTPFRLPIAAMVIPVLVLAALGGSHKVLVELKTRQLWNHVFGSAKPSHTLCWIGGICVITGFILMNCGAVYFGWKRGDQLQSEVQHAKAFVSLIKGSEQEFMTALKQVFVHRDQQSVAAAIERVEVLEKELEYLKKDAAHDDHLLDVLTAYGNAVRQWKSGVLLLKEPNPDRDQVKKLFASGDESKKSALQAYNLHYGGKKP